MSFRKKREKKRRIKAKQTRGEKQGKKERTCFKRQMLGRELIGLRGRGDFLYLFF